MITGFHTFSPSSKRLLESGFCVEEDWIPDLLGGNSYETCLVYDGDVAVMGIYLKFFSI